MSASENLRAGERRNVTVLFADMKDFTALSEGMDPEEIDSLMTQVFTTFEAIIRRYGGAVEKYIGDAMVAVFGVPQMHEDDPSRAVNAGLDLLEEIIRVNSSLAGRGLSVAFRIGITTGLITTGRRGDHDVVTGHAMSVASRLESSARADSVLVAQTTKELCESEFTFSDRIVINAKGLDEPVIAYAVTGRLAAPRTDSLDLVGRTEILSSMMRRYLRHDHRETAGFLLTGEAGIGKTRIALELMERVRRLPDFAGAILFAKAQRYRIRPFAVVADLLASYFEIDSSSSTERIVEAVTSRLDVEAPTARGFAGLLTGTSEEQDSQAFVLLYLILKSIVKLNEVRPYPALLAIDDLRFIDKGSRDFFQFYLRNADIKPFFVLTDRQPEPAVLELFNQMESVPVPPLGREESRVLIDQGSSGQLSDEMVDSIMDNARGNPLFIREYVRFASENRDTQNLPTTIQNIFLTSIDNYEPGMRDLLKKLSVFAHSFSLEDARHVERVTDGDERIVGPSIGFFLREGVIVKEDDLYMFRYDVFKTALYNSILNYNKRILHRVIADLMEQKGTPHPLRLLHHLCRAGEYARATMALLDTPSVSTGVDYLKYVDRLLDRAKEEREVTDSYSKLMFLKSAILFNNGISGEADALLKEIIDAAITTRNDLYAGNAYHLLLAHNLKAFCFGKARSCGLKALAHYAAGGWGRYNAQNVLELLASAELLRNHRKESERFTNEIAALESIEDSKYSRPRYIIALSEHALMLGQYRRAHDLLQEVIADVADYSEEWYGVYLQLGLAHFHLNDWSELRRVNTMVLEGPSRHLSNISQVNARLAVAHHFLGETKEAGQRLQQAEFNASQIRNDFDLVDAQRTLAECYLIQGDIEKAERIGLAGLGTGLRHSATYPVLTLLMVLTEIAVTESDSKASRYFANEARLLIESGVLLRRRDVMLYHYYSSQISEEDEDESESRGKAVELLTRELEEMPDERLVEAFFRTRRYGRIHSDLLGHPNRRGASSA